MHLPGESSLQISYRHVVACVHQPTNTSLPQMSTTLQEYLLANYFSDAKEMTSNEPQMTFDPALLNIPYIPKVCCVPQFSYIH